MSVVHGPVVVEITLAVVIHCVVISSVKFVAKKICLEFVTWDRVDVLFA